MVVQAKLLLRFFMKGNPACYEVPIYSEGYDEIDAVSKLSEAVNKRLNHIFRLVYDEEAEY